MVPAYQVPFRRFALVMRKSLFSSNVYIRQDIGVINYEEEKNHQPKEFTHSSKYLSEIFILASLSMQKLNASHSPATSMLSPAHMQL